MRFIKANIDYYNSINLELRLNKFLQFTNWYVVYDSYKSFIVGMEARIKLSECCYQSIPLLSIEEYASLDIKNSIAIYLTNSDETKIQNFIAMNHYHPGCTCNLGTSAEFTADSSRVPSLPVQRHLTLNWQCDTV